MIIKTKEFIKPSISLNVREGEKHLWKYFHNHHYMTVNKDVKKSLPSSCKFFTFYWIKDGTEILVGCLGVLFQISKKQPSKRLTRIVVLPEYQGLGFSSKMINSISEYYSNKGFMIYCSSYHSRLGEYWKSSVNWKAGMYNLKEHRTPDYNQDDLTNKAIMNIRSGESMYRYCYTRDISYDIIKDVLEIDRLQKTISALTSSTDVETTEAVHMEIQEALQALKELKIKPTKLIDTSENLSNDDNIAYIPVQKRTKRKILTSAERKQIRSERRK